MGNTRASQCGTGNSTDLTFSFYKQPKPKRGSGGSIEIMDFSIPEHSKTSLLNGEDLQFFYYDICQDHMQGWPSVYDWDSVVTEFTDSLNIGACDATQIPNEYIPNTIRFNVSHDPKIDNASKSAAFFRHLRNAFAHYHVVREGANYVLTDIGNNGTITMRGLVDAEVLKQFCFRFFSMRDKIMDDYEDSKNPTK